MNHFAYFQRNSNRINFVHSSFDFFLATSYLVNLFFFSRQNITGIYAYASKLIDLCKQIALFDVWNITYWPHTYNTPHFLSSSFLLVYLIFPPLLSILVVADSLETHHRTHFSLSFLSLFFAPDSPRSHYFSLFSCFLVFILSLSNCLWSDLPHRDNTQIPPQKNNAKCKNSHET